MATLACVPPPPTNQLLAMPGEAVARLLGARPAALSAPLGGGRLAAPSFGTHQPRRACEGAVRAPNVALRGLALGAAAGAVACLLGHRLREIGSTQGRWRK